MHVIPDYTFLFDVAWETTPFELKQWWSDYALQRYGKYDAGAEQAWSLLAQTVYGTTQEQKSMCKYNKQHVFAVIHGSIPQIASGHRRREGPRWYHQLHVVG